MGSGEGAVPLKWLDEQVWFRDYVALVPGLCVGVLMVAAIAVVDLAFYLKKPRTRDR